MVTKSNSLCLAGITLLVGILIGVGSRRIPSQTALPLPGTEVGRYQLVPVGSGTMPYVYFLDTKTGRCWMQGQPGSDWTQAGPLDVAAPKH